MTTATEHWERIYSTKSSNEVSWYQREPSVSLRLVTDHSPNSSSVVDVGAGASYLTDHLVSGGYRDITLVDVSRHALDEVAGRLGPAATQITFARSDVLFWRPKQHFDVWHDRAVFHFLTGDGEVERYAALAENWVTPGGALILATFALDGPTHCSGLLVQRYDADGLEKCFGGGFTLEHHEREEHVTPSGTVQNFTWVVLRRGR